MNVPRDEWPRSNYHKHEECGLPIHLCMCPDFADDRETIIKLIEENDEDLDDMDRLDTNLEV